MISHINLGTSDLTRAVAFYTPILGQLGWSLTFKDPAEGWAGWQGEAPRPLSIVGLPANEAPHAPGNGQMVALLAPMRAAVDAAHRLALEVGGTDEGAPGLRPHYHADYYVAYFRDPDGNKICVCCHAPEGA